MAVALASACAPHRPTVPSAAPPPGAPLAAPPAADPNAPLAALAAATPLAPRDIAAAAPAKESFAETLRRHGAVFEPPRHGKAILVNVPAFELIAFENGEPALRSRVIVGSPKTPTPIMDTWTSVVRFRPTWRPTPDMIASGEYEDRIVPAGKKNPLGLLAVRLEPGLLIYLHGTNKPKLFERDRRALSHGCVRVEKWDELAAWVLGIPVEEVHASANGASTFDMETSGVPVFIRYYTDFPDETGRLARHDDVYALGRGGVAPVVPVAAQAEPPAEPPPSAVFGAAPTEAAALTQ
jgi:lipoprotein-anchoring transpeptidase ErfK/SrfK